MRFPGINDSYVIDLVYLVPSGASNILSPGAMKF